LTINTQNIIIGIILLLLGASVYIIDRPPSETYFIFAMPFQFSLYDITPSVFGSLSNFLPHFFHVTAFIFLTAGFVDSGKRSYPVICLFWMTINLGFELGQKYGDYAAGIVPAFFDRIFLLENTRNYFLYGTYCHLDAVAIIIGGISACVFLFYFHKQGETYEFKQKVFETLRYVCLCAVIVLGLVSIIGTGGSSDNNSGDNGGDNAYTVTATAGAGGSVAPSSRSVDSGSTTSFTVTPASGYSRDTIVGGTCPVGSWSDNTYTTGSVTGNCSVSFSFNLTPQHTVTASTGTGGSVSPSSRIVDSGSTTSFTVTPAFGYSRDTIVEGTCPVGSWSGNTYTIGDL
jgi:hypothetical protein